MFQWAASRKFVPVVKLFLQFWILNSGYNTVRAYLSGFVDTALSRSDRRGTSMTANKTALLGDTHGVRSDAIEE